jgi:hypothetical protein
MKKRWVETRADKSPLKELSYEKKGGLETSINRSILLNRIVWRLREEAKAELQRIFSWKRGWVSYLMSSRAIDN